MASRLPTIDETVADLTRRGQVAAPSATPRDGNGLRKLAAAVAALPEPTPTFDDLYSVKSAIYG